jgi:superfamily I DNA/RNA helicase
MTDLNSQQQAAVEYNDGHLLIVAGPGTGKTHTITQKIAKLLQSGVTPENIIALTFTRKAGEQMKQRLKLMLPQNAALPFAGTFHSFCLAILREHSNEDLKILSQKEQEEIKKTIGGDETKYREKLVELGAVDFDGILEKTYALIDGDPALRGKLHGRIRYLFVDEYQDVNEIQYRLIKILTGPGTLLCAIGDPDQAIYSFRGADLEHFLRFEQDFPGTRVIHLEQNYRSTPDIVDCAGALIKHNSRRIHKNLRSCRETGPEISVMPAATPFSEAIWIAKQITRLVGGTDMNAMDRKTGGEFERYCHFTDIAVIYRTNQQGKLLETALKKEGLPFQRVAATPWFGEKEVETVLGHLARALDPGQLLPEHEGLKEQYENLRRGFAGNPPSRNIKNLLKTFHLEEQWKDGTPQGEKSWNIILRLLNFAAQFDAVTGEEGLGAMVAELKLLQEHDAYDDRMEAVSLMSIHASKGLEFPVVFIAGLEEGTLPYIPKNPDRRYDREEERRLMYVGLTRAKERLYLSYSQAHGETGKNPSGFLKEIAEHCVEIQAEKRNNRAAWRKKQLSIF